MTPLRPSHIPKLGELIRHSFIAGIFVVIPFAVIAWMLMVFFQVLWDITALLPPQWRPESVFQDPAAALAVNLLITLGIALVLAFVISLIGWISKQYLGEKLLNLLQSVIQRIPVIRSVYGALDQLLRAMATGKGQQFNRVVYVEYPRRGSWVIAFVTGPSRAKNLPEGHINVYVPTTPNPTSGFHLIVPEAEVRETGMRVEEAFRTLLSLGIAQ